ncbi:MAG: hypothetical protein KG028_01905 [Actinobacteria bacterium]|nr:hypothetical protein [Actinomycetota bacterium]
MRRTPAGRAGKSEARIGAAGLAIAALAAACNPAAVAESSAEAPDAPASMTDEPVIESVDVEMPEAALPPEPPPVEAPFALSEADVYLNAKRLAADVAQALTTYDPDQSMEEVVADFDAVVDRGRLAEQARDLHHPGTWSRGRVIYSQLGGVTADRVSVMVTTEQRIGDAAGERRETRTLDVRLLLREGAWVVESLASDGGSAMPLPDDLSEEARAVLEDPRIELPDSARWDIIAGEISPQLLRLMARAADQTPYGVVVLSTGHPFEVFGTERQSFHTMGRAVDIYRVDERLVIDDREEGSATYQFLEWFYDQPEVSQIGAPWALDGYGGRSFTDVVHQDHLHVGVRAVPVD